jgi:hypothetical protein
LSECFDPDTNGIAVVGGSWSNTAAINRITLFPGAGNWIAASRLTIYGLGS